MTHHKLFSASTITALLLSLPTLAHAFGGAPGNPVPTPGGGSGTITATMTATATATKTATATQTATQTATATQTRTATATATETATMPKPTPGSDFLGCNNKLTSGSWTFGTAPAACSVSPAQSTAFVNVQYNPVIYKEGVSSARKDYMSELYPVARELGTYYIKRRNSKVSAAEIEGFLAGFYSLLNQETFWTHYRKGADGITRYMRGDSLHGFGIMQVDDRSHSVALNQGKGVDLVENMLYGLDIFYANWVKSASVACVKSASDYEARARAAWAAYNGGSGSICRFTNADSKYASHDQSFYAKFKAKDWLDHVTSTSRTSALDVTCLSEGARPCALKR